MVPVPLRRAAVRRVISFNTIKFQQFLELITYCSPKWFRSYGEWRVILLISQRKSLTFLKLHQWAAPPSLHTIWQSWQSCSSFGWQGGQPFVHKFTQHKLVLVAHRLHITLAWYDGWLVGCKFIMTLLCAFHITWKILSIRMFIIMMISFC